MREEKVMIYLDHSATTKPLPEVVKSFTQVSEKYFANPSSVHELGGTVEQLQTKAREQVASGLQVQPGEVIFTSGGTEGNNIAIKGVALQHQQRGKHIITTAIEHASVYDTCHALEKLGFKVTYLPVDSHGVVDVADVKQALTDETILVSIMHVNNEIGSIQPIAEIGKMLKAYPKVFFHVDAVQGLGKVPLQLANSSIDLCTFSGHKIHGLKGTGVLFVKSGTSLFPLFHGGNQEFGIRSGTENVAGNVAFARALRLIKEMEQQDNGRLHALRQTLIEKLKNVTDVHINSPADGAPHVVNLSVLGLKPETIIHALYERGAVISTQSACTSKRFETSRVLSACGFSKERASCGLRISLSYETTETEIAEFVAVFTETIGQLKEIME